MVVAITPYNYPITIASWKAGMALAAGCTVVLMPALAGALATAALAWLAVEAGVPSDVLQVLFPAMPRSGRR